MNNRKIAFMFSGQGSQFQKMGQELYEKNEVFREWMLKLSQIYEEYAKVDVVSYLYKRNGKRGAIFDDIVYTHPAIYMIQYSLAMSLMKQGVLPHYVIGVSLGEYVSLSIAGVITYKDALKMLAEQVRLLKEYGEEGTMITILEDSKMFAEYDWLYENSTLIAVNYEKHFVVACDNEKAEYIKRKLREHHIASVRLPVHYAFHSSRIDCLKKPYENFLDEFVLCMPKVPVYSSMLGKAAEQVDKNYLWQVLREPMQYKEALQELAKEDVTIYLDLGPSGTLENIAKNILKQKADKVKSILTIFPGEWERYSEVISFCKEDFKVKGTNVKKKAYLFPGQGSQVVGMGQELFDEFPELTQEADEVLGYSIKELCLEDKEDVLGITKYTQPALYVVNILEYLKRVKETGEKPDYVAGHSLGEYCALYAAGVFDFKTGLKIVKKRAELMNEAHGGGMAAVIGLTEEKITEIMKKEHLSAIDIANLNTEKQIAISGIAQDIANAKPIFEKNGARAYVILKVSGAFHSRYMEIALEEFGDYITQFEYKSPEIPVISNYTARPYKSADIVDNMKLQMVSTVKWCESMCYLMGKGVEEFIQIGPGDVISGMIKRIKRESKPLIVEEELEDSLENVKTESEDVKKVKETETFLETENNMQPKEEPTFQKQEIQEKEEEIETEVPVQENGSNLGSKEFKERYGLSYAYLAGSMDYGISTEELVYKLGKAGCLAFLGTKGVTFAEIHNSIKNLKRRFDGKGKFGVNLSYIPSQSVREEQLVNLCLECGVDIVEASSYFTITLPLAKYKIKGLVRETDGTVHSNHKIIMKVGRPDIAALFMKEMPDSIIEKLLEKGEILPEEAELAHGIPLADDICVTGEQAGPTEHANIFSAFPIIQKLREESKMQRKEDIHIGIAGGIGTPEAVRAAFLMGADFIMTGSVHLCTVESGMSKSGKDLLQAIDVQDTEFVPSLEMFELDAKWQVMKKGVFFPARMNNLYEIYRNCESFQKMDLKLREKLEKRYFNRTIASILAECKEEMTEQELQMMKYNEKYEMALVFKWFMQHAMEAAIQGNETEKVNYCIKCSSALGSFNRWVKGTSFEKWENRHVDEVAIYLMKQAENK